MNRKGFILIAIIIPHTFLIPAQEEIVIVQFDQQYELFPTGNLRAIWDLTIVPEEGVKSMLLHAFFSKKAYVKDVIVSDAQGSLNSRMISGEDLPILEINFRERLSPGAEYHFTCDLDVWKAVDIGETEGSFVLLTGYNFPVEVLNITATLPEGTELRNFFPSDGQVSSGRDTSVSWTMNSLPAGYTIQVSVSFGVLSESYADNLFSDGENLYSLQDLESAREKFEEAFAVYQSLNLQEKVDQCSLYLDRIDGLEEGLPVFENAVELYNNRKYTEALTEFEEVKSIYEEHQVPTDEIDGYIDNSKTYVDALTELQRAEIFLEEGNKKEARDHFLKARELFSEVNDTTMMERIDSMIEQVKPEPETVPPQKSRIPRLVVGAVLLVVVIAAVLVLMKLRKPVPVYTKEEIREEMRQLKARFVYGEINKKEYEERLDDLEKQLKEQEPSEA